MACILWDKSFSVNMTRLSERCSMEHSNMCCSVDLDVDRATQVGLRTIVKAQQRFRQRRVKAVVIQRAVKRWLQCKAQ